MAKRYTLTKPQRAAAIIVAMGKPRASDVLKFFRSDELRAMIEAAHTLKTVPQPDLEELVAEFESEFSLGVGLLDSASEMQNILSEFMSAEELEEFIRVKSDTIAKSDEKSIWSQIEECDPEKIMAFLKTQPPMIVAFILSKLPTAVTAATLEKLDGDKRRAVVAKLMSSRPVSDKVRENVEKQLAAILKLDADVPDDKESASRLAEVLNEMGRDMSDSIVADMNGVVDEKKVALVQSLMFRFEDISQLAAEHRTKLCDGLPSDLVTTALRGADDELREAILSSIGQRARRMIESELDGDANIPQAEINRARRTIASLALKMGAEGQIALKNAA